MDLKCDSAIKTDHRRQVEKYKEALQHQLREKEKVYEQGLIIAFPRESATKIPDEEVEGEEVLFLAV